ncbi:unnamed protein product [Hymenolepis diminuta]|nr:unnamed protein product [Hymenolepis diminuta]
MRQVTLIPSKVIDGPFFGGNEPSGGYQWITTIFFYLFHHDSRTEKEDKTVVLRDNQKRKAKHEWEMESIGCGVLAVSSADDREEYGSKGSEATQVIMMSLTTRSTGPHVGSRSQLAPIK